MNTGLKRASMNHRDEYSALDRGQSAGRFMRDHLDGAESLPIAPDSPACMTDHRYAAHPNSGCKVACRSVIVGRA
jgi:hypothetical protein